MSTLGRGSGFNKARVLAEVEDPIRDRSPEKRAGQRQGERAIAAAEPVKTQYKSALEDAWKRIPAGRFWRAIAHIETVLLSISTDGGPTVNDLNGVGPAGALNHWAEHLRSALKELTR